jgi:arsenate reductase-like glutaredoxin family protein
MHNQRLKSINYIRRCGRDEFMAAVKMMETRNRSVMNNNEMPLNFRRLDSVSNKESAIEAVARFIEKERLLNNPIIREEQDEKITFHRLQK